MRYKFFFIILALASTLEAFGMTAEPTRLVVWKHGEAIGGDEFIAQNEAVVDYLATLRRPTGGGLLATIKYDCMAKMRATQNSVQILTPQNGYGSVVINTVYELRDCKEAQD